MYHLVQTSTGAYLGGSKRLDKLPSPLPLDTEVVELPDGDEKGIWNESTKSFDPRPLKDKVKSSYEASGLFTFAELSAILADKNNPNSELMILLLQIGDIKFNSDFQSVLNQLEADGLIAAGRALEIFNG